MKKLLIPSGWICSCCRDVFPFPVEPEDVPVMHDNDLGGMCRNTCHDAGRVAEYYLKRNGMVPMNQ